MIDSIPPRFSVWRSLKIGSFNIGSALVDILTASVWNRVMITDLGAGATPVSILLALRYLLAPLSIWAGFGSDARPIGGLRRTPYIWIGRALMLLAVFCLPISLAQLSVDLNNSIGWLLALVIFVAYGTGTAVSGGPFSALIHDRTPAAKRGLAISIAQVLLLLGFAISPIMFGRLLPAYSPEQFQALAILAGLVCCAVLVLRHMARRSQSDGGRNRSTRCAALAGRVIEAPVGRWACAALCHFPVAGRHGSFCAGRRAGTVWR